MTKMAGGVREGVAESYDDLAAWQIEIGAGEPSKPIIARRTPIFSVLVQNPSTSLATVFVGNNDLQPIEIVAGREVTIRVRNAGLVFARSAGNVILNCLAEI